MKKNNFILLGLVLTFVLTSFLVNRQQVTSDPVDDILAKTPNSKLPVSIVLYDMDTRQNDAIDGKYLHRYQVITNVDDPQKRKTTITDFLPVNQDKFVRNYENMGMEVASKIMGTDGNIHLNKVPAPLGYANYIGNTQYGQWKANNEGRSYWAFDSKYMFLGTMFHLENYPVYKDTYSDYRRNYHRQRAYYGSTGTRNHYGTGSRFSRNTVRSGFYASDRSSRARQAYRQHGSSRYFRSDNRGGYSFRSRGEYYGK
ncbi:MAG TPA: hypothetical protein DCS93_22675 [Microscillaceae bacterium]|nr:hypothetical protein [Microscillaceae bacterium]